MTSRALLVAALAGLLGLLAGCSSPPAPREQVFVTLPAASSVERIDPVSGSSLGRTLVGALPHNLLRSADGRRLYVALVGSQAVAELDAASGELLRTFLTEPLPLTRADGSGIAAHQAPEAAAASSCFACHRGGEGGAKPVYVGSRPFGLALSADGETLYVSNIRSGALSVIDLATGELKASVPLEPVGQAHEATGLARLGDSLYVTLLPTLPTLAPHPPAILRRLELATLEPLSDTPTGRNSAVVTADPARGALYVSNAETNTVSRFGAAGEPRPGFTVGNSPIGQLLVDGALYVANFYDGSVSRIDLASGAVQTQVLELGGTRYNNPTHLTLSSDGQRLYLVSGTPQQGHLLVLEPATLQLLRAWPISGLGFDLLAAPR